MFGKRRNEDIVKVTADDLGTMILIVASLPTTMRFNGSETDAAKVNAAIAKAKAMVRVERDVNGRVVRTYLPDYEVLM